MKIHSKKLLIEKLLKHNNMAVKLKELKEEEMELRKELCEELLEVYKKENDLCDKDLIVKGKFSLCFPDFIAKFELSTTSKLDEESLEEDWDELNELEAKCIKRKTVYSVIKKEFDLALKALEKNEKLIFRIPTYITEKPAAPTLSIENQEF